GLPVRGPGPPGLARNGVGRFLHGRQSVRFPARVRAVLLAPAGPRRALRRIHGDRRHRRGRSMALPFPRDLAGRLRREPVHSPDFTDLKANFVRCTCEADPVFGALRSLVMTTIPAQTDVVIIGAGHNGLVSAILLARAGLDVVVLESASVLGGATRTERP